MGEWDMNLIFWLMITFGPKETQTAHSSYADILLVSIGLISFVLTLPRVFYFLLFGWQLFNFFVVWVWSMPARIPPPEFRKSRAPETLSSLGLMRSITCGVDRPRSRNGLRTTKTLPWLLAWPPANPPRPLARSSGPRECRPAGAAAPRGVGFSASTCECAFGRRLASAL